MASDEEVILNRLAKTLRPPSSGNSMNQQSSGRISMQSIGSSNTIVDETGGVRRLWLPGDPWSQDFFFGGGELD